MTVPSVKYTRVCSRCGDTSSVTYKPKGHEICSTCRGKDQAKNMIGKNTKAPGTHKRYTEVCSNCDAVATLKAPRKGTLCGKCSSSSVGKSNKGKARIMTKLKKPKKQHLIVCPHCPDDEGVRYTTDPRRAGIKPCRKHMNVGKPKKVKQPKKPPEKVVPVVDGKQKVKIKKVNDEPRRVYNSSRIPISTPEECEDMIARYLKKSEVTVIKPLTSERFILRERYND